MTQDAPGFLSRELARKTAELVRAQGNGSGNAGQPGRGNYPPQMLAQSINVIVIGDYGTVNLIGWNQQVEVYARHKSVNQGENFLIAWTSGNEISTLREDDTIVRGQWEVVAAAVPDNSGLPVATPPGTCGCNNCWPGVPLTEEDEFRATCGCVNRIRIGVHSPLTIRFPDRERIEWGASGGKHVYNYQGDGIWLTRLFDSPFCDDEETLADRYYYKLDANTKIVTLEIDGDPEEANCPVIKATWCFADGCAFSCLCPWIFKRYQPFKYAESPESCNLCITPVRQVIGQFCDPVGCELTPLMALTIPEFSFGVSTQPGHEGDMDVALLGYVGQSSWPLEIELPSCIQDTPVAFLSLGEMDGSSTTVLVPYQEASGIQITYAAFLTDADCPDGTAAQIFIRLECGFNEEDQRTLTIFVDMYFYATVVGGTVGAQNGCVYARYQGESLLSDFCTESHRLDRYFVSYDDGPLGLSCGDDNLVDGDAQVPTTLYLQPYSPIPPNTSGEDAADCGGEPFEPLPGGECASEQCVLEVEDLGGELGKRWTINTEETSCEGCGSCQKSCGDVNDSVCGAANDYTAGYKCFKACSNDEPEPCSGATELTVSGDVYADFPLTGGGGTWSGIGDVGDPGPCYTYSLSLTVTCSEGCYTVSYEVNGGAYSGEVVASTNSSDPLDLAFTIPAEAGCPSLTFSVTE